MALTPQQALAYVEERRAELTYEHTRTAERLAAINYELYEVADQARLLRQLIETNEGAR